MGLKAKTPAASEHGGDAVSAAAGDTPSAKEDKKDSKHD